MNTMKLLLATLALIILTACGSDFDSTLDPTPQGEGGSAGAGSAAQGLCDEGTTRACYCPLRGDSTQTCANGEWQSCQACTVAQGAPYSVWVKHIEVAQGGDWDSDGPADPVVCVGVGAHHACTQSDACTNKEQCELPGTSGIIGGVLEPLEFTASELGAIEISVGDVDSAFNDPMGTTTFAFTGQKGSYVVPAFGGVASITLELF